MLAAPQCVVFLDVDGVLHSLYGQVMLEERCCMLLEMLVLRTGAALVLSSTWRMASEQVDLLNRMLEQRGLPLLYGCTRITSGAREDEICEWLDEHPWVSSYAAVDIQDLQARRSMSSARLQGRTLVTNPEMGLTLQDVETLVQMLGCGQTGAPTALLPPASDQTCMTRTPPGTNHMHQDQANYLYQQQYYGMDEPLPEPRVSITERQSSRGLQGAPGTAVPTCAALGPPVQPQGKSVALSAVPAAGPRSPAQVQLPPSSPGMGAGPLQMPSYAGFPPASTQSAAGMPSSTQEMVRGPSGTCVLAQNGPPASTQEVFEQAWTQVNELGQVTQVQAPSLDTLMGNWLINGVADAVVSVGNGGYTLYKGVHMGIQNDLGEYMVGGVYTIQRGDGWSVDPYRSNQEQLVWVKPGEEELWWIRPQQQAPASRSASAPVSNVSGSAVIAPSVMATVLPPAPGTPRQLSASPSQVGSAVIPANCPSPVAPAGSILVSAAASAATPPVPVSLGGTVAGGVGGASASTVAMGGSVHGSSTAQLPVAVSGSAVVPQSPLSPARVQAVSPQGGLVQAATAALPRITSAVAPAPFSEEAAALVGAGPVVAVLECVEAAGLDLAQMPAAARRLAVGGDGSPWQVGRRSQEELFARLVPDTAFRTWIAPAHLELYWEAGGMRFRNLCESPMLLDGARVGPGQASLLSKGSKLTLCCGDVSAPLLSFCYLQAEVSQQQSVSAQLAQELSHSPRMAPQQVLQQQQQVVQQPQLVQQVVQQQVVQQQPQLVQQQVAQQPQQVLQPVQVVQQQPQMVQQQVVQQQVVQQQPAVQQQQVVQQQQQLVQQQQQVVQQQQQQQPALQQQPPPPPVLTHQVSQPALLQGAATPAAPMVPLQQLQQQATGPTTPRTPSFQQNQMAVAPEQLAQPKQAAPMPQPMPMQPWPAQAAGPGTLQHHPGHAAELKGRGSRHKRSQPPSRRPPAGDWLVPPCTSDPDSASTSSASSAPSLSREALSAPAAACYMLVCKYVRGNGTPMSLDLSRTIQVPPDANTIVGRQHQTAVFEALLGNDQTLMSYISRAHLQILPVPGAPSGTFEVVNLSANPICVGQNRLEKEQRCCTNPPTEIGFLARFNPANLQPEVFLQFSFEPSDLPAPVGVVSSPHALGGSPHTLGGSPHTLGGSPHGFPPQKEVSTVGLWLELGGTALKESGPIEDRRITDVGPSLVVGRAIQQHLHVLALKESMIQWVSREHFRLELHGSIYTLTPLSANPMWLTRGGQCNQLASKMAVEVRDNDVLQLFTGAIDGTPEGPGSGGSLHWTFHYEAKSAWPTVMH